MVFPPGAPPASADSAPVQEISVSAVAQRYALSLRAMAPKHENRPPRRDGRFDRLLNPSKRELPAAPGVAVIVVSATISAVIVSAAVNGAGHDATNDRGAE